MSRRKKRIEQQEPSVKSIVRQQKRDEKEARRIKRNEKRAKFFKRLTQITMVILLIVGVYYFDQSKYSRIRSMSVSGNEVYSSEALLKPFNIKENDRIVTTFYKSFTHRSKLPGIAKQSLKLYYTKGKINLTVEEYPVVAVIQGKDTQYLLSDNSLVQSKENISKAVPVLSNMDGKFLKDNPDFADKLSRIDPSTSNSISEVELVEDPLEDVYFKFTMNHGYFVYTSTRNILLMDYYPDIVSGIQAGSNKDNRCIYFLDYGLTEDKQSAVSKPCEPKE